MEFLNDASNKRFLALIAGVIFPVVQQKLGINVDHDTQIALLGMIIAYIAGSHTKEAVVARAGAAGKIASDKVTQKDAADIIKEASK